MKLHKKLVIVVSALLIALTLVACTKLNKIEFSGIENVELEFGVEFNVLTNVKAIGNDKKDYTDKIVIQTVSKSIDANGKLDTTKPGETKVRYSVKIDEPEINAQVWRTIVVKSPESTGEGLLQNGDFSQGTAFWIGDQGSIESSVVDGALKLDIVAGGNSHEPRLHQMAIPFEQGKTYEVKFNAKSSVDKTINLQVGELLANAPWFTDFKPMQIVHKDLTEEWTEFSFKFKHNLDNKRGGLLFEFGKVDGNQVDATVWLKNVTITEVEAEADTEAPKFAGIKETVTLLVGTEFNALAGITAFDVADGDVTEAITYVIKNSDNEVVTEIDSSVVGTYTIEYEVSDKSLNKATATVTVSFIEMTFKDINLVVNGDFSEALGEEWTLYKNAAEATMAIEDNKLLVDVQSLGGASYDVQLFQEGIKVEQGKTYRISFKISSTVARDFNLAFGVALTQDPWFTHYMDIKNSLEITTEEKEYSYVFTVSEETTKNGKLVFELGNTANGELGVVTISDVKLQERDVEALIDADFTNEKHVIEQASGDTHATAERTTDKLTITVSTVGTEAYIPHYFYMLDNLEAGNYKFKLSIKGDVARTVRFNIVLPDSGHSSVLPEVEGKNYVDIKLVEDEVYELIVDFNVATALTNVKVELDFGPIVEGETNTGVFELSDILLYRK
ncbi:carbohydrate binding domain-containing protein [Haploplasma axanthum]|uniref:Carbohydrate binding domain n=1 Tax=Haploplasma axanthum TaxID=29552 RepID=A0A449BE29_HAPAX|nr:carbohydrate binding domain-containing protein [Haploplasma axanthum]VEU80714.1 Carbohydrate binding domain [Haploplasma axanthum]